MSTTTSSSTNEIIIKESSSDDKKALIDDKKASISFADVAKEKKDPKDEVSEWIVNEEGGDFKIVDHKKKRPQRKTSTSRKIVIDGKIFRKQETEIDGVKKTVFSEIDDAEIPEHTVHCFFYLAPQKSEETGKIVGCTRRIGECDRKHSPLLAFFRKWYGYSKVCAYDARGLQCHYGDKCMNFHISDPHRTLQFCERYITEKEYHSPSECHLHHSNDMRDEYLTGKMGSGICHERNCLCEKFHLYMG